MPTYPIFVQNTYFTLSDNSIPMSEILFPFMVRYPFDLLRAVSKVEPLTTNGKPTIYRHNPPFVLRFTRLRRRQGRPGYRRASEG
jgi:hypothetical protein